MKSEYFQVRFAKWRNPLKLRFATLEEAVAGAIAENFSDDFTVMKVTFEEVYDHQKEIASKRTSIFPADPYFWNEEDRQMTQCGHCFAEFDDWREYFRHLNESAVCGEASTRHAIATTFPYIDLRHYRTPAAAAKALHAKLLELGYNEAFIMNPKEAEAVGYSKFWHVGLEGGPFEWAVAWTGTGAASAKTWYCECYYSFSVSFVR